MNPPVIDQEYIIRDLKNWPIELANSIKIVTGITESRKVGDKGEATESAYQLQLPGEKYRRTSEKRTYYGRPKILETLVIV